jgi:hypothetical protein
VYLPGYARGWARMLEKSPAKKLADEGCENDLPFENMFEMNEKNLQVFIPIFHQTCILMRKVHVVTNKYTG